MLTTKGMNREDAYRIVQTTAMEVWRNEKDFKEMLKQNSQVTASLSVAELEDLFDLTKSTRHVDTIFRRVGLD